MGKSPGKWIKTVLFGKKSSRSNISKAREKHVKEKEASIISKASGTEFSFNPTPITFARNERDSDLENKDQADIVESDHHQDADTDWDRIMHEEGITMVQASMIYDLEKNMQEEAAMTMQATLPPDQDKIKQEEAATKVQATCRGYLARRAFKTLKGIIRLQALIRGHLVRRQAISTLCCMYGIIKLQAVIRGRRVRQSKVGYEIRGRFFIVRHQVDKWVNSVGLTAKIANMSANIFIHKLLASSTATTALYLQFPSGDPNSFQNWLERWSVSQFWKPVPKPKKVLDSKSQRKQGDISDGDDIHMSKPKRGNWKIPSSSSDLVLVKEIPDFEKPKRILRKVSSKSTDPPMQENSENEFEKVKRNLRKVHSPVLESSLQPEEEFKTSFNEKMKMDSTLAMSNEPNGDVKLRISVSKDAYNMPYTQVPSKSVPLREDTSAYKNKLLDEEATDKEIKDSPEICNDENSPLRNGNVSIKEDSTRNENPKPGRKSPVPAKQELLVGEDGLQNSPSPSLPSYMAATESAKAKLRAQGSLKIGQDSGGEKSNVTRRHSLPSSSNSGKSSSHSPRTQRPAQAGGKRGHRSDKTNKMSSSKDGKLSQADWRR